MKKLALLLLLLPLVACEVEKTESPQQPKQETEPSTAEPVDKETGVVGATCWSDPIVFHNGRRTYCFSVDKVFYPGIVMISAKQDMIRKCQRANALDPAPMGSTSTCYKRCQIDTHCLYGDNR